MLTNATGFKLDDYTFCGKCRKKNSKGGVGILVRNDIKHVVTPHEPIKDIEMYWISIQRKDQNTVFCGVYYGKQETRTTKEQITLEMDNLSEEILEKQKQGDVLIFMDANAKLGILGEAVSRNGKFLQNAIDECELYLLNKSELCRGMITRVNRKRTEEKSAIDFVLASEEINCRLDEMQIDENEDYVLTGMSTPASDHNSIIVRLQMGNIENEQSQVRKKWFLNAPEEKWQDFQMKLMSNYKYAQSIMRGENFQENYNAWKNLIERMAIDSIGKITIRPHRGLMMNKEIKNLQKQKREAKKDFEKESISDEKRVKQELYILKQKELRLLIEDEREKKIMQQFEKMIDSCNDIGFWRLCKNQKKDQLENWVAVKDENGHQILNPDEQKEYIAKYFESLFSPDESLPFHPYHEVIKEKITTYSSDLSHDEEDYNSLPSLIEVENIIKALKNNKATTEFPNEILKRGGRPMAKWIFQIVKYFWENEIVPISWNQGVITTVYKGKGDRERLNFQRGITVSNSISMICEELLNKRMSNLVSMTQAQGGSRKKASTRDHLFILRGAIDHSLRHKTSLHITFYDVAKAYDRADVEDMMVQVWEHGFKGKAWRLMKALNTNLTAVIKTRHGITREIKRNAGGKQGGKNFGFLFAKLMDLLSEEAQGDENLGITWDLLKLAFLLWIDDVVSFAEGKLQQSYTLNVVDEFAKKHKLKWGTDKCKVMVVGRNAYESGKWNLGESQIETCEDYRYLGDIISRNNSNQRNIEERENRVKVITRKIISLCGNEVISKVEIWARLKLHETTTISSLLTNSESWVLNSTQRSKIDRIELGALKKLLNVPPTTPTLAIMLVSGTLFASQRIDQRQMIYLKTILNKTDDSCLKIALLNQETEDSFWAKQMKELLSEYDIEKTWDEIKRISFASWKGEVRKAVEKKHKDRLISLSECTKKATFARAILDDESFQRKPMNNVLNRGSLGVRALIMGMAGMLDCANNFHYKYKTKNCKECQKIDDEMHRINDCVLYKHVNLFNSRYKFDFQSIYSDEKTTLDRVETLIRSIWTLDHGKNVIPLDVE